MAKMLVLPALKLLYQAESATNAMPLMVQVNERAVVLLLPLFALLLSFLQDANAQTTRARIVIFFMINFCLKYFHESHLFTMPSYTHQRVYLFSPEICFSFFQECRSSFFHIFCCKAIAKSINFGLVAIFGFIKNCIGCFNAGRNSQWSFGVYYF